MEPDANAGGPPPGPRPPARGHVPRSEYAVAAVLLVFGAVVYALTTQFEAVPVTLSQGMPPSYFPRLLVWSIAVLTVAMLIESRSRAAKARPTIPPIVLVTAALLVLALVVVRLLGLLVALYVFSVVFPLLWGERRYRYVLGFAVLFPTLLYLLFAKVLEVQFPHGLLLHWLGM